jgi:hypothetical protein
VREVVLAFFLLESQLQLANSLLDMNLQHHILRAALRQSVIHLNDGVALEEAHQIDCLDGVPQMVDSFEHDLGPEEVAHFANSLDVFLLPLDNDIGNFFNPNTHDLMDNIPQYDISGRSFSFLLLSDRSIDLGNDNVDPVLVNFILEHLLENPQDYLKLLLLILGDLHTDPVQNTVGLFLDIVHDLLEVEIRASRSLVNCHYLAVDLSVVGKIFYVPE